MNETAKACKKVIKDYHTAAYCKGFKPLPVTITRTKKTWWERFKERRFQRKCIKQVIARQKSHDYIVRSLERDK